MRAGFGILFLLLAATLSAADRVAELAKLHVSVLGGAERLEALAAIRATGIIFFEGRRAEFSLTAARPNRLRLESKEDGQKLVQGYDGIEPPWEFDPEVWPPRTRLLSEPTSSRIVADAEYDGPLIAGTARGYRVDFTGEVTRDGHPYLQLAVSYRFIENYVLLIDAETYLIAYRIDQTPLFGGEPEETVTHYDLYQPVDGVLIPHVITTLVNGRETQRMRIDRIEANPPLTPTLFVRPDGAMPPSAPRG